MSRARNIALTGLVFVGAYLLGRVTTDEATPPATQRIVERGGTERTVVHHAPSTNLDDVRAVVREELAQRAVATEPPPEPIDEARLAAARAALDQGMADRRWSEADRDRLQAAITSLSRAEMQQILGTLFPALNAGQLVLEYRGAPL